MVKRRLKAKGFTLIEVMIALAIFSFFIAAFVANQGYNLSDSATFKDDIKLRTLAEQKINEIIASPPVFNLSLTLSKDTGKFEDNEDYSYEVIYKEVKLPNLAKLKAGGDGDSNDVSAIEKKVFETIEKNFKILLWQLQVKITNNLTKQEYILSTWLYNHKGKVEIGGF